MITANDLRIGNWIKYDKRYFQIDSIATVFPTLSTREFGIGVVDYYNIEPIPLTEDILLKCGFIEDRKFYYLKLSDPVSIVLEKIREEYVEWHYDTPLKHLHELQNLYYAITKTELIINL